MRLNRMALHRHILALISFFYLIVSTYAYSTDLEIIKLPGLRVPKDINVSVLEIGDVYEWLWANLYIGLFYVSKFVVLGYILEITHPAPKTEDRKKMTLKQQTMGVQALFWVIIVTTLFMWFVEPVLPYYGYYATHEFGIKNFVIGLFVYMFAFDTWFWFTHVALHHPFFMKTIHAQHHQFVEPSAFAQDAVHPIEAIIQGPLGHYMGSLFYPIHPVCLAVFGLGTSIFALFAHDGRWDPNFHVSHHYYKDCQFGIYWGFWDIIFGTRYSKQKFPVEYIPSWERKNARNANKQNEKVKAN